MDLNGIWEILIVALIIVQGIQIDKLSKKLDKLTDENK